MLPNWHRLAVSLLLAAVMVAISLFLRNPGLARTSAYPLVRALAALSTERQTRDWAVIESEHFRLKYRPEDADIAPLVLVTAEEAYGPVTSRLNYRPRGKSLILLYPDRVSLARQFGWAADESAMGVYWAGVIRILSPYDWVSGEDKEEIARIFRKDGPMVHEFAHLIVDGRTRGNYPRWLTEGIAQYLEREVTGFEMPRPAGAGQVYNLEELDARFDDLPDQNLAYRQSLELVEYIIKCYGWDALDDLLNALGSGTTFNKAVQKILGQSATSLLEAYKSQAL
ncbi:MAG: hypothetical protein PWP65_553 [Clostridia bacterium]|nr:hypothetical protein [Clostridia bacterium]